MRKWTLLASLLAVGLAAEKASATLFAYEGFDYPTAGTELSGSMGSLSGGTGDWDTAWRLSGASPSVKVSTAGLSYPGLPTAGLASDLAGTATTINFRNSGAYTTGDVWLSFLARPTAANSIPATNDNFFGLTLYDSTDAANGSVIGVTKPSNGTRWALAVWGTNAAANGGSGPNGTGTGNTGFTNLALPVIQLDTTYLLVARFHFATGTGADLADFAELYVNPALGANPPGVADVTYLDATAPTTGRMNFDRIRIASQMGRGWLLDEVRLGSSFGDVVGVPEASSLAFVSLSLATVLWGCWRRPATAAQTAPEPSC